MRKLKISTGFLFSSMLLLSVLLAACGDESTPTTVPTTTQAVTTTTSTVTTTVVPITTTKPVTTSATTTSVAPTTATTTVPTVTPTTAAGSVSDFVAVDVNKNVYLDDRSNALLVLRSFYNAINRHEYTRAYGYWQNGASQLQPYPQFEKGYTGTENVQLSVGQILSGAAAGTTYTTLAVLLNSNDAKGANQTFTGCYTVSQPNAANYGAPPIQPYGLYIGNLVSVPAGGNVKQLMQDACNKSEFSGSPVPISEFTKGTGAIDASQFVDDRSSPESVLRSLYNAVNRHEYVRAYSYWRSNANGLQPYPQFEQGYANTSSVQVTFGTSTSSPGAGQIDALVPVTVVSRQTGDKVQTFVGCYYFHYSQAAFYTSPPFPSIGVSKANLEEVPANADTKALMSTACSKITF